MSMRSLIENKSSCLLRKWDAEPRGGSQRRALTGTIASKPVGVVATRQQLQSVQIDRTHVVEGSTVEIVWLVVEVGQLVVSFRGADTTKHTCLADWPDSTDVSLATTAETSTHAGATARARRQLQITKTPRKPAKAGNLCRY